MLAAPRSRLVRFHAWQAALQTVLLWAGALVLGLLTTLAGAALATALGFAAGLWVFLILAGLVSGASSASQGRFFRVVPAAPLLSAVGR